ncbi:hypothetical protein ABH912_000407 [Pseudomonas sp. BT76 TE3572]|uniref:hypothetical protein n=1 Tax=Pseudomonas sp. BT76 TE3572 TaxID=3349325 RepID=UPI003D1BE87E
MDHSLPLKVVDQGKIESLRERMDDAGCIFEFVIVAPDSDAVVDESTHRRALYELYEQIMVGQLDWHFRLVQELPDAEYPVPTITWDLDKAIATPLTPAQVRNLTLTDRYEPGSLTLCGHFRGAVNSSEFEGGEEDKALFLEWIEVLGLQDQSDVVVLNWINGLGSERFHDDDLVSVSEPWSEYFSSGAEWRSGWCLTIWNPRLRSLSAIAASG